MNHKPLDKTGIFLAVLCALHCIFVPVFLPMLSMVGLSFLGLSVLEHSVLGVSLVIGGIAIIMAIRHHHSLIPLLLFLSGAVVYMQKEVLGHHFLVPFVLTGASLLIAAHALNIYLCRLHRVKECQSDAPVAETNESLHETV